MNYYCTEHDNPWYTDVNTTTSNSIDSTIVTNSDVNYQQLQELQRIALETASGCVEEFPEIIDYTPVPDFPIPRKVLLPVQSGFKKEKFHSRKLRSNKIIYVRRKRNYRNLTKEIS